MTCDDGGRVLNISDDPERNKHFRWYTADEARALKTPHLDNPCPICKARAGAACRKKDGMRLGMYWTRSGQLLGEATEHYMRQGGRGKPPAGKVQAGSTTGGGGAHAGSRQFALTAKCSQCNAEGGRQCLGATGKPRKSVHRARFADARKGIPA